MIIDSVISNFRKLVSETAALLSYMCTDIETSTETFSNWDEGQGLNDPRHQPTTLPRQYLNITIYSTSEL